MTCSKCHLFNSLCWLHHLWTQHGLDCWPSVAGATCRHSAPHTNTPRERASLSQEGGRGGQAPLPAVCDELIHQLSGQGVHLLSGRALGLQGQVDLLQAGFLRSRQARMKTISAGQRYMVDPSPRPRHHTQSLNQRGEQLEQKKAERHQTLQIRVRPNSRTPLSSEHQPDPNPKAWGSNLAHSHEEAGC